MTELLTESFCERCGTRYTFQTAAPKGGRVRSLKVLSKGLRNFVASDDISLSDAFADARSDQEREASSHQLEAFHQTFNFCLDCRQYTCGNCWNDGDNRCLTCAPDLSRDILPAAFPAPVGQEAEPVSAPSAALEATSWPSADLEREAPAEGGPAAILAAAAASRALEAGTEPVVAPAAEPDVVEAGTEPQVAAAAQVEEPEAAAAGAADEPAMAEPEAVAAEPEAVAAEPVPAPTIAADEPARQPETAAPSTPAGADDPEERAAAAAIGTTAFLRRFRPGESLDAALAEFEAGEAAGAPEPTPAQAAPPVAPPEPVTPPAAAAAATPPAGAPQEPTAAPRDVVGTPTWRITAPDGDVPAAAAAGAASPAPGQGPASPPGTSPAWPPLPPGTEPSWPVAPQWPPRPATQAALDQDAMWAASNREVASSPAPSAVRPCVSCGLSLSSTARFCRRCGSPQG